MRVVGTVASGPQHLRRRDEHGKAPESRRRVQRHRAHAWKPPTGTAWCRRATSRSTAAGGACCSARPSPTRPSLPSAFGPKARAGATSPSISWIPTWCSPRRPRSCSSTPPTPTGSISAPIEPAKTKPRGFYIRRLSSIQDAEEVNRIYSARGMVTVPPDFFWSKRDSRAITYFVAEDEADRRHYRHRHRRRSLRRVRRHRARLFAVVSGRRSASHPARHRRSAGAPAGGAFQGARRVLHGPLGDARQRAGHRALREARLHSAGPRSPSSARTSSTRGCSPRRRSTIRRSILTP